MAVSPVLLLPAWCIFISALYIAVQQFLIESTNQKGWLVYRLFLALTCLNECIITPVLLFIDFDTERGGDKTPNGEYAILIRSLIWMNNILGGYTTYKVFMIAIDWLYKQVSPTTDGGTPKWLSMGWLISSILFVTCRIVTLVISFLTQDMTYATQYWTLFIDAYSVTCLNLIPCCCCIYMGYRLHGIIRQREQSSTRAAMTELAKNDNPNPQKPHYVRNLKRLKRTRAKIFAVVIALIISVFFNGFLLFNSIMDVTNDPISIQEPQFNENDTFIGHFLFVMLYIIICLLAVYQTTKCCYYDKLDRESIYISYFHCKGNSRPNCHHSIPCLRCGKVIEAYDQTVDMTETGRNSQTVPKALDVSKDPQLEGESIKKNMKQYDDDIDERDITALLNEIDINIGDNPDLVNSNSSDVRKETIEDIPNAENYRSMRRKAVVPLKRQETPTQRHESTLATEDSAQLKLGSEDANIDLNNIDREGRKLGKRRKKQAKKMDLAMKEQVKMDRDKVKAIAYDIDQVEHQDIAKIEDTLAPHDGVSRFEPSHEIDMQQIDHRHTDIDDEKLTKEPILLVIYEFEDVLASNMKKIAGQAPSILAQIDLDTMLLVFGGVDRLEKLHEQFNEVILKNKETMCFVLGQEKSQAIFKTFERVDFAQYFVSVNQQGAAATPAKGRKSVKRLSHVIGSDHKLWEDADGKKHLLILRLMNFLKFEHGNVLFISHDKAEVDHANDINLCRTYYVKTSGLTERDLQEIAILFKNN